MRRILLLVLIVSSFSAHAQKKYEDRLINGYHDGGYLTLNVLSLGDLRLPTIQPGFEYKINNRLGLEAAVGLPVKYDSRLRQTDTTFFHYYKLRSTARYYIYHHRGYLGFELYYTHSHYSEYRYEYSDKNFQNYHSDYAESRRSVYGFDLKYAWIFRIGRKLFVETFAGMGPRFVTVGLQSNVNPVPIQPRGGIPFGIQRDRLGTKTDLYTTLGLQFVYRL